MKFMLEMPAKGSPWTHLNPAQLNEALVQLQTALENGSFDCAYSKTGGGGYIVVNADSHAQLHRTLRMLHIHDVNVVPVSAATDVLKGYIEHHESGAQEETLMRAQAHIERYASLGEY